jgi:hypothetical protein
MLLPKAALEKHDVGPRGWKKDGNDCAAGMSEVYDFICWGRMALTVVLHGVFWICLNGCNLLEWYIKWMR